MSMHPPTTGDVDEAPKPPAHYAQRADAGDETWLEDAIEDYLGIRVTAAQREICRAVAQHKQVLVVTANGLGKSYILAAITIVWLLCRYPAVSFATSGTERKMKRTYCKPVENLHGNARIPLPGEYKSRPERIEIDGEPEHFFEASSPRDAGELEGVHGAYTLAIIEEADKDDVDEEVIDAMRSLATDDQDRLIAIANPPEGETNSIHRYMDDHPKWEVLRFSSFDAHNVQVELGNVEGEKIDGIATISKIRDDWEEYNGEPWPGIVKAQTAHERRNDLGVRWYRRRAGVMPPEGSSAHRPITVTDVEDAWERTPSSPRVTPTGTGIDVARSGDNTVLISVHEDRLKVHYSQTGTDHPTQEARIRSGTGDFAGLDSWPDHPGAVDAAGEGSGLADRLTQAYPKLSRFNAGATANEEQKYKNCWTEGLAVLGQWLKAGGSIDDRILREELLVAARTVEYDENFYASRGTEVLKASPKEDVQDVLGRSPDHLDAALMAVFASTGKRASSTASGTGTWGT